MNIFRARAVKDVDDAARAIPVDSAPALQDGAAGRQAVAGHVRFRRNGYTGP